MIGRINRLNIVVMLEVYMHCYDIIFFINHRMFE